ncbi:MAG: hypothetical protein ABEH86_12525 [Haloarcula sp.]
MENLGEAYEKRRWEGRDPRRVVAGVTLGFVGALAVVVAILLVTTPLSAVVGATAPHAAEKLGGTLGGLGIPAMFLSVVTVLPSSRREQTGVVVGAILCLVGLGLFQLAYPYNWTVGAQTLAFETTMAYFIGTCVAFWFVFTAMAGFRRRNNPQGTVKLEISHKGETKTVQVSPQEYRRYTQAVRGDGGTTDEVIQELESRIDD